MLLQIGDRIEHRRRAGFRRSRPPFLEAGRVPVEAKRLSGWLPKRPRF